MPSANSNINWRRNQNRHNATADKISNPNHNRLFGTRRHNKKPHDDANSTKLLYQSKAKMNKTSILISIYIAVLIIYSITVMI